MIDVVVGNKVIARAENEEQKKIYTLDFLGESNNEIAVRLNIPLESVTRFTEGGATR